MELRSITKATSGSAATVVAPLPGLRQVARLTNGAASATNSYLDNQVLKFTQDGQFLMQIGKPAHSKGSNDIENLRLPAKTFIDKQTNEVYVADGYGNHRVIVYDADTGQYKRHWGAYGHKPDDTDLGKYDPDAPPAQQFRNPVHCADMSVDRLVYVCDRVNDRIQVFKPDGTFIKEGFIAKRTLGSGSAWDIAFSKDPPTEVHLPGGRGERPRPHPLARHPRSFNHVRRGWAAAGRILRPAQHRHGFERQHLRDRDLSRPTRAEVCLQGPGAGHKGRPGRPVAEEYEKVKDTYV